MAKLTFRTLAAAGALVLSVSVLAKGDEEAVNKRIAPVARVELAAPAAAAPGQRTGEQLYKAICGACHEAGVAGAPKTGDKAAWAPRIALGLDGLMKSATAGKNAMPPKGGSDANEVELARAIVYITNKSGGNLKEPAAK
jgi:cytochrome c5